MAVNKSRNILIVDGFATGNQYARQIRARGMVPYHITSGLEKTSALTPQFMEKYIASQVGDAYEKCFRMPDDLNQAAEELRKYNFLAVIPGTETGVVAAERLAQAFGLPVNKPSLLYARCDKYLMQKALEDAGLAHIESFLTAEVEEAVAWFREGRYKRIIIKPVRSAGTDGVRSCTSEEEIRAYFAHSYLNKYDAAGNFNSALLLQEYVEGDEMVVNCVSRRGKHILTDIVFYNKLLTSSGVPVYEASRLVHKPDARMEEAVRYAFHVLDALGIMYGSSHSEIKLTDKGPVLVETGARVMGSTPPIYYEALGYSLIDWSLDAYLSDAAHARNARHGYAPKKHFMAKFFISSKEADVEEVTAEKTLPLLETFAACNFNTLKITKRLRKTVDMPSKPGDCLLVSEDESAMLRDYNLCRYMEHNAQGLLWKCTGDKPTEEEKKLLECLHTHVYPIHPINRFLYGYSMAYKNYKTPVLYVLRPDLTHCEVGETGNIYVAGAYMAKKAWDMPCLKQENFVTNPFYTTACSNQISYPFLYNTGDQAEVNDDGTITFIDAKTGRRIRSFGRSPLREEWPLTYTERQMVAEQQLSPESNAYNTKFTFHITGTVEVPRLEEAIKIWLSRYRIFRSYYPAINGKFVHRLMQEAPVQLSLSKCTFDEALQKIEQQNKPYDLTCGPLYRFALFEVGEEEYVFHINMHHIIADGTSLISIIEELWKLYNNKHAKKFRLERQDFLDYADWQNKHEDPAGKKAFFLELFKDGVPENEMPTRGARPEILPHATEVSRTLLFDVSKIDAAARSLHVSTALFMMMASSLAVAKYCASEDITLGMIMNGRTHPQTKEMFGMFVNSVPVRFRPEHKLTLAEYARISAGMFRGVLENQMCPFELLAPLLAPQRNLSRKPVFDVIVNYRGEIRPFETDTLKIRSVQMWQATQIDMQFEIVRGVGGMNVSISYSRELYEDSLINGMLDLLEKIVNTMCASSSAALDLGEICELPSQHKDIILKQFAGKRVSWDLTKTPVDLFRARAAQQPERPAVCYADRWLTYRQLDAGSDGLAACLQKLGIKRQDKVAVLLRRSELFIVSALGILKAGAAYVPLDAAHPSERLQFILQDTQAKAVIADEELIPLLGAYAGTVLTTEQVRREMNTSLSAEQHRALQVARPAPEDLFVILYTSGTTGQPKGVMLTHKNLTGLCYGGAHYFSLTEKDNIASVAGFGFDACLSDFYPTLSVGACLHIIEEEKRIDLVSLNDYFEKHRITGVLLTTQLGRQFVTGIKNRSLRYLIVGGETLTPVRPPAAYALYNAYGPTECTVYTSYFHVDKLYDRVPLGKPIHNASVYITGKDGRLCPVGTFGELCIAGNHVSKGYLHQPEMTAQRFLPNPFSKEDGFETLYKTGDVARYTSRGNIDFIGRRDCQVKVRGFRIELSEIETCLRKYPALQDCTVVACTDKSGGKFVAGYMVSAQTLDIAAVKRFLEDRLPPYMIPEFLLQVPSIALNPNGKVDRAALPDPLQGATRTTKYVSPEGRTEKELAFIWADVLNIPVEKISREDNFFDVGGTSLRSTELSLRVRETFKENMPPAVIFKYPTLKKQAAYLEKNNRFSMVYAFNENGKKTPIFFVHTANTGAEAYVPLAAKLPPDQPFYAVEPHNIFSEEKPIRGIKAIAKRYVRYIQKVSPDGPYKLGGWSFGALVAYEMAVQLRAAGKKVENVYLLDPIIEHSAEEKELTRKLLDSSFFQGYLNNDPLFGRFKKLGFMDKLIQNNRRVLEDMFAYSPSYYDGKVTLFKATRLADVPKDVDPQMAADLHKCQLIHHAQKQNGFEKYVKQLSTVRVNAIHDYMMRGNALEKIAIAMFPPRRRFPRKR